jgi:hypothetical protein
VQHKSHGRHRPEMLAISGWCVSKALGKPEKLAIRQCLFGTSEGTLKSESGESCFGENARGLLSHVRQDHHSIHLKREIVL